MRIRIKKIHSILLRKILNTLLYDVLHNIKNISLLNGDKLLTYEINIWILLMFLYETRRKKTILGWPLILGFFFPDSQDGFPILFFVL